MIRFAAVFTFFLLQIINEHSMVKGDEGHSFGGRGGRFSNSEGFPMSLFQPFPLASFFPPFSQNYQFPLPLPPPIKDVIEKLFDQFLPPQPRNSQFTPNSNPNHNHNSNPNHNSYPNPNYNSNFNPNHNSYPNPNYNSNFNPNPNQNSNPNPNLNSNFNPNPNQNSNPNPNLNSNFNPNPNHNSNPNPYPPTNPQNGGTTSGSNSQPPPFPAPPTTPTPPTVPAIDPGSSNPTADSATS